MEAEAKKVGPDGYRFNEWTVLDFTTYRGILYGNSRSQGCAAQVKSYRNGKYACVDSTGYRFIVHLSQMSTPQAVIEQRRRLKEISAALAAGERA